MQDTFSKLEIKIGAAKIRGIQMAIADVYKDQMIRCPIHLSIGQDLATQPLEWKCHI